MSIWHRIRHGRPPKLVEPPEAPRIPKAPPKPGHLGLRPVDIGRSKDDRLDKDYRSPLATNGTMTVSGFSYVTNVIYSVGDVAASVVDLGAAASSITDGIGDLAGGLADIAGDLTDV